MPDESARHRSDPDRRSADAIVIERMATNGREVRWVRKPIGLQQRRPLHDEVGDALVVDPSSCNPDGAGHEGVGREVVADDRNVGQHEGSVRVEANPVRPGRAAGLETMGVEPNRNVEFDVDRDRELADWIVIVYVPKPN